MSGAGLLSVDEREQRARKLVERRLALGIPSGRAFADLVEKQPLGKKVSRDAIMAAENGSASSGTYDRLEAWLNRFEEETGEDMPSAEAHGLVTFRLSGNFGVEVTVQGPVENVAELEQAVERLIRKVGEEQK